MIMLKNNFFQLIRFKHHLIIGFIIRLIFVIYGEIHDRNSNVQYTDIDYKVITDGARYLLNGDTPFKRHTFRYSPLLAIIVVPNIFILNCFGKLLFSLFDIFVTILIQKIVYNELKLIFNDAALATIRKFSESNTSTSKNLNVHSKKIYNLPERYNNWSKFSSLIWLYNPLSMIISTRGNGDSFSCTFILLTVYYMQKFQKTAMDTFLCGIFHGLSIHLRIYPIIFSLPYYLCLTKSVSVTSPKQLIYKLIYPNKMQLMFILGAILSLLSLTAIFTKFYGYEYIFESFIYHIIRDDKRHNFSLYFLMKYLCFSNCNQTIYDILLIILPKYILIIYLSFIFGNNLNTLSFCLFCQTFILVTYNTVVTSQYFIWYLSLFPLCLKNLRNLNNRLSLTYFCLWILGQLLWLIPAYLLEFKCLNTFNFMGIQGICFFFINIFILQRLIYNFDFVTKIK